MYTIWLISFIKKKNILNIYIFFNNMLIMHVKNLTPTLYNNIKLGLVATANLHYTLHKIDAHWVLYALVIMHVHVRGYYSLWRNLFLVK